jgi:hypothetical protein
VAQAEEVEVILLLRELRELQVKETAVVLMLELILRAAVAEQVVLDKTELMEEEAELVALD